MRYDNTFVSAELAKLMRLGTRDVGRLPVVDRQNPKRLVGTIRRHDIVRACKVGIGRKLEMQTRGKQLRLGNLTGTEIIDVVVLPQSPAAHRAVKELNLPKGYLMVIAISSCLFTIISIEGFPLRGASQDTARVAAQIVTGVGFLGAGVVLRSKKHVRGLTTAATIWLVAALGMAIGAGIYFVAVFATVLSTILVMLLAPVSHRLEQRAWEKENMQQATQKEETEQMDE